MVHFFHSLNRCLVRNFYEPDFVLEISSEQIRKEKKKIPALIAYLVEAIINKVNKPT